MSEVIRMLAESQARVKALEQAQQVRGYMRVFEFSASSCYECTTTLPLAGLARARACRKQGNYGGGSFNGHLASCMGHSGLILGHAGDSSD